MRGLLRGIVIFRTFKPWSSDACPASQGIDADESPSHQKKPERPPAALQHPGYSSSNTPPDVLSTWL